MTNQRVESNVGDWVAGARVQGTVQHFYLIGAARPLLGGAPVELYAVGLIDANGHYKCGVVDYDPVTDSWCLGINEGWKYQITPNTQP